MFKKHLHTGLNVFRRFSLCHKVSQCTKGWSYTRCISGTNLIFPSVFRKACQMLIQNNIYCWIETTRIEIRKALKANFITMLDICQYDPFDIITVTPRGTLGLCCVHIAQLMTNSAIYTTPFTLQLCCKPLDILKRVTKSQKAHISNHDGLEKLHNINFVWHRSQGFPKREQNSRNSPFTESSFLRKIDLLFFKHLYRSIILWLPFIHHINICWETWFFIIELMEEVNQPQNWLTNIISSYTYG